MDHAINMNIAGIQFADTPEAKAELEALKSKRVIAQLLHRNEQSNSCDVNLFEKKVKTEISLSLLIDSS